jgi:hydroxyacylglutathione hydrolase
LTSQRIRVEAAADGRFATNSYLVMDEDTHDAVVIDANMEPNLIVHLVREIGAKVKAVLLTHTDIDHIAGLPVLLNELGPMPVAVHDAERQVLTEGTPLRREFPADLPRVDNVTSLSEQDHYRVGSLDFEVLHTPGHSPGGVTLKIGNLLFTGDALFAGSIGRSDFRNSDGRALIEGIRSRLLSLPDDFTVYSGHGPATTIGQERRQNPFLQN